MSPSGGVVGVPTRWIFKPPFVADPPPVKLTPIMLDLNVATPASVIIRLSAPFALFRKERLVAPGMILDTAAENEAVPAKMTSAEEQVIDVTLLDTMRKPDALVVPIWKSAAAKEYLIEPAITPSLRLKTTTGVSLNVSFDAKVATVAPALAPVTTKGPAVTVRPDATVSPAPKVTAPVVAKVVIPDNVPEMVELPTAVIEPVFKGSDWANAKREVRRFPAVIFFVTPPMSRAKISAITIVDDAVRPVNVVAVAGVTAISSLLGRSL
jgi:hypothetical protein